MVEGMGRKNEEGGAGREGRKGGGGGTRARARARPPAAPGLLSSPSPSPLLSLSPPLTWRYPSMPGLTSKE